MKVRSALPITLTPAQRGHIVQRVIVDGWSSAEAGSAIGVPERLVDRWVADYRRHGMASLRHVPHKTIVAEIFQLRRGRPTRLWRAIASGLRRLFVPERPASPSRLVGSRDDRRGGS